MRNINRIMLWLVGFLSPLEAATGRLLQGSDLSIWWALPFIGMLLSIATGPILFPKVWHHHYGKVSLFWLSLVGVGLVALLGFQSAQITLFEILLDDYIPFLILIGALYTINSGFYLEIRGHGGPLINAFVMLVGAIAANFIGTTGASLLFIQPLIRLNAGRKYKTHTVIFFIFIVCNIGGALTPIGDPPLFLGFLNGINFLWPLKNLWIPTVFVIGSLILIYMIMEAFFVHKEQNIFSHKLHTEDLKKFHIQGKKNCLFLLIVIVSVVGSGLYQTNVHINILGCHRPLEHMLRDICIFLAAVFSYAISSQEVHRKNNFSWEPIEEIALIFAGIFITAVPVFAMLHAKENGVFASLVQVAFQENQQPNPGVFFWASGALSAFLDNAPTYLVFFHLAGGNPQLLMGEYSQVLSVISCASVYMGALTYIGNAPNFIIRNIAHKHHIEMPSFFGYMKWSCFILLPLFYCVQSIIKFMY